jgi:hypothetical protein
VNRFSPALRRLVLVVVVIAAASPALAEPPRLEGDVAAQLSITVRRDAAGTAWAPGPFTPLPGGTRVAIYVPEAGGILVLEEDRILHHFPVPDGSAVDDLAASGSLLVAGRRPRQGPVHVSLSVFDVDTGRLVQRVESANPYLRAPAEGRDKWRIVVEGDAIGAFDPVTAATYPLWDRSGGAVRGSDQVIRSIAGIGLGPSAAWIPNPDGSVARKVRGRAVPFSAPEDGEFVGGTPDGALVLLQPSGTEGPACRLPRELIVRVLEGEHAISELHLAAVSDAVTEERCGIVGRPVQLLERRLYWARLGHDDIEIRTTALPPPAGR